MLHILWDRIQRSQIFEMDGEPSRYMISVFMCADIKKVGWLWYASLHRCIFHVLSVGWNFGQLQATAGGASRCCFIYAILVCDNSQGWFKCVVTGHLVSFEMSVENPTLFSLISPNTQVCYGVSSRTAHYEDSFMVRGWTGCYCLDGDIYARNNLLKLNAYSVPGSQRLVRPRVRRISLLPVFDSDSDGGSLVYSSIEYGNVSSYQTTRMCVLTGQVDSQWRMREESSRAFNCEYIWYYICSSDVYTDIQGLGVMINFSLSPSLITLRGELMSKYLVATEGTCNPS